MYIAPTLKKELIRIYLKRRKRNSHSRRVCSVVDRELKKLGYQERKE